VNLSSTTPTSLSSASCSKQTSVKLGLERAAEAARQAGVHATTTIRAGNVMKELLAEAGAVGSGELFFVRTRGRIRAALTGKAPREVAHVSLAASTVKEFAKAA
jgi:hypothetical protein